MYTISYVMGVHLTSHFIIQSEIEFLFYKAIYLNAHKTLFFFIYRQTAKFVKNLY